MMDDLQTHGRLPESGWPSYVGLTFLDLDNTMDKLEIVQLLVHHQLPPLSKGNLEHYNTIVCFLHMSTF